MAGEAYPRILVYSDVDGCIIGPDYQPGPSKRVLEEAKLLGIPVVPVSSKTVYELLFYLTRYGLGSTPIGVVIVAEEGAAIYSSPGLLAEYTYYDRGLGLEVLELSPRLAMFNDMVEEALRPCRGEVVRFTESDPRLVARLAGLGLGEAYAATKRAYTEVVWSKNPACMEAIRRRAEEMGMTTYRGKRFLHLALHRGKYYALRVLLSKTPRLRSIDFVIALGDTELDREMIENADLGVVIPHKHGVFVSPRGADYTVALLPGPEGWAKTVREQILANT